MDCTLYTHYDVYSMYIKHQATVCAVRTVHCTYPLHACEQMLVCTNDRVSLKVQVYSCMVYILIIVVIPWEYRIGCMLSHGLITNCCGPTHHGFLIITTVSYVKRFEPLKFGLPSNRLN